MTLKKRKKKHKLILQIIAIQLLTKYGVILLNLLLENYVTKIFVRRTDRNVIAIYIALRVGV